MAKQPSRKILARIARAFMARYENHDPVTGAQVRGQMWNGPLPRRLTPSTGYTPEHAEANHAIDARNLGFGVVPGSNLAHALSVLPRSERRLMLAALQSKAAPRRARLQRRFQRAVEARGFAL